MKISKSPIFQPVIITLDTYEEVERLLAITNIICNSRSGLESDKAFAARLREALEQHTKH